jgi:aminomethyltransferase
MNQPNRKTALYDQHVALKAKMVPFGGWNMPVMYTSVLDEHHHVRNACGLFDVSHMGEVRVKGPDAEHYLQYVTINNVQKLSDGAGQYSAILNPDGGMIDDLIIYRLKRDEFFICVNASNADKDFAWLKSQTKDFNVEVTDESSQWSQIAVQGPKSKAILETFFDGADRERFNALAYTHIMALRFEGKEALVARTGYTGEWGYELYLPHDIVAKVWLKLLNTDPATVKPIGLGARDTLRLEACYLLYGNDMNDSVSPLEAGIGWATKLDKGDFIGKPLLDKQKSHGIPRQIYAFKMEEDGIPRAGMKVVFNDMEIGAVTSGSVLPTVGGAGGMALLKTNHVKEGDTVWIDVRGKPKKAAIAKRPLYSAKAK